MSQTIRAHSESYAPTQHFETGSAAATQAAVRQATVFNFESYQQEQPAPRTDSVAIGDLVSRWEADPRRREALSHARVS